LKIAWIVIGGLVLVGSGCGTSPSSSGELQRVATIKDIMDSMVDPSGDFMFESVVEIADEQGVRQEAPQTDEEWEEVRRHALVLFEAPNLLVMEDRKVALPHEKAENPSVELEPEQIQALIDADRPTFIRRAQRLQEAAASALKAVDSRSVDELFHSIENIDRACENCHLHYWYPNDERAQQAARESGLVD